MFIAALFSGHKRGRGPWTLEPKVTILAAFAGIVLDLREAHLPAERAHITSWTLFGGTKVIAPKGLPVSISGLSIFGGSRVHGSTAAGTGVPSPQGLRIASYALLGGLEVAEEP